MDSKKTNLTPELKEIYDRVMNTSSNPQKPPAPAQSQQLSTPPSPSPQEVPVQQPAAPVNTIPSLPDMPPPTPDEALTSTPPRPIQNTSSAAFNGVPQQKGQEGITLKKKARISLPILIVLGLLFVIVWGIFWAVILGLIPQF